MSRKEPASPNGGGLVNLTDVNRKTLEQTDEEFQPHSWEELRDIIGKPFSSQLTALTFVQTIQLT